MTELFSRQQDTDLILLKCENQKPYSLRQAGKGTFYFKLVEPAVLSGSIFLCSMPGWIFHCHFTCQGCVGVLSHQYLQHRADQAVRGWEQLGDTSLGSWIRNGKSLFSCALKGLLMAGGAAGSLLLLSDDQGSKVFFKLCGCSLSSDMLATR